MWGNRNMIYFFHGSQANFPYSSSISKRLAIFCACSQKHTSLDVLFALGWGCSVWFFTRIEDKVQLWAPHVSSEAWTCLHIILTKLVCIYLDSLIEADSVISMHIWPCRSKSVHWFCTGIVFAKEMVFLIDLRHKTLSLGQVVEGFNSHPNQITAIVLSLFFFFGGGHLPHSTLSLFWLFQYLMLVKMLY